MYYFHPSRLRTEETNTKDELVASIRKPEYSGTYVLCRTKIEPWANTSGFAKKTQGTAVDQQVTHM